MSNTSFESVLHVGEVFSVEGIKATIKVAKNKNNTDFFYNGTLLKNVSVNNFIEIRKGFLSIIGKVEGEKIVEEKIQDNGYTKTDRNYRLLSISLVGVLDNKKKFIGGTKELPLIGNKAYLLSQEKINQIHSLTSKDSRSIEISKSANDNFPIKFPIDGLFNSHIAIFGNTGSGKSNTLTSLYSNLIQELTQLNEYDFKNNCRYLLFDFNGEYTKEKCITPIKKVYNLNTRSETSNEDKIPLNSNDLLNLELLTILSDATEKTQKPFLKRTIDLYKYINDENDTSDNDPLEHFKNFLKSIAKRALTMSDKEKSFLALDYFREILEEFVDEEQDIGDDLDWLNKSSQFVGNGDDFLQSNPSAFNNLILIQAIDKYEFSDDFLTDFISFLYVQLIKDILSNRAQNDHIAPVINKFKSKIKDFKKLFKIDNDANLWEKNFLVINLSDANIEMKKTVPLLISKKIYSEHKSENEKILNIIIDEAHNILSHRSNRESESWKDYRLETFEEIIKEGRKFGVFMTISSQRPSDISNTITSQAHNYFIHRLINNNDLDTISKAVSYIDKITEESIPTLPTGTCIFSGVATQMPLKISVYELGEDFQPKSNTLKYSDIVKDIYNFL